MTDGVHVDRYAVLGNPVAHSRSPFIQAAFAQQTGQALRYERLPCPLEPGGFDAAVRTFAEEGAAGCNVTVPFKFDALRLAARRTPRAALAGAANTLRLDADGWLADNTDGVGLLRDIEANAGVPLAGRRVLLVGAGGAAAGVLGPLLAARPACIVVANRTPAKALALVATHAAWAAAHGVAVSARGLTGGGLDTDAKNVTAAAGGFDLVVNASASSLHGAALPLTASVLAPGALAVDLMYGAAAEPFLAWVRAAGATARDGVGMLVEQAAESFFVWRGVRPDTPPVLQALRAQLQAEAQAAAALSPSRSPSRSS